MIVFLLLACLIITGSYAQKPPYNFSYKKDIVIAASGLLFATTSLVLHQNQDALTPADIALLDSKDVWPVDRSATEHYSESSAQISDMLLVGSLGFNAFLPLAGLKNNNNKWEHVFSIALLSAETNLLNYGGTELVKVLAHRTRPFAYNPVAPMDKKLEPDARKSFFSGHTSFAAANSFLAATVISDFYPDSKWNAVVWTAAALFPAWTGMQRYWAGKHFPTDVLAGYTFGAFCGWFIPYVHKHDNRQNVSMLLFPEGFSLAVRF